MRCLSIHALSLHYLFKAFLNCFGRISVWLGVAVLIGLTGCQHPTVARHQPLDPFLQIQQKLPAATALPPYETLYQAYLQSPAVHQTGPAWQRWQQQISAQPETCAELPWRQALAENFWSLIFYQAAEMCLQGPEHQELLQWLRSYQAYVLAGILASGNGHAPYAAFQINSYRDAHAVIQALEMQTIDYYIEFLASDNALYYVFQVFDPTAQRFKAVYFHNMPYLHAIDEVNYPFIGLVESWKTQLFAENQNPMLVLLHATDAHQQQNFTQAAELYQQAMAAGSLQARVGFAELCLQTEQIKTNPKCLAELIDAADQDYLPAIQLLSFLHHAKVVSATPAVDLAALRAMINERAGEGAAELQLSRYFFNSVWPQHDQQQGEHWLAAAASSGHRDAQAFWTLYQFEQEQISSEAAMAVWQPLALSGHSVAAFLTASQLLQQPQLDSATWLQIENLLQQASQQYHPEAFHLLALLYQDQRVKTADPAKAMLYLRLAAERFYPRAMLQLGLAYQKGQHLSQDLPKAQHWFLLCSKQGHAACAYQVGLIFDEGIGVEANPQQAYPFYQFAAEKGHPSAQTRLALLYLLGQGVTVNSAKAIELLESAAAQGSMSAHYYLGVIYFEGQAVPKDLVKARQHFEQAAAHPAAQRYLTNWQTLLEE